MWFCVALYITSIMLGQEKGGENLWCLFAVLVSSFGVPLCYESNVWSSCPSIYDLSYDMTCHVVFIFGVNSGFSDLFTTSLILIFFSRLSFAHTSSPLLSQLIPSDSAYCLLSPGEVCLVHKLGSFSVLVGSSSGVFPTFG